MFKKYNIKEIINALPEKFRAIILEKYEKV